VIDFVFVIIELFRSLTVRTLQAETYRRSRRFTKWVGHFQRNFQTEGTSSASHCRCPKKIQWLLFRVVSKYSQCIVSFRHKARMWQTDGRTDRITTANTSVACVACVAR